MNRNILDLDKKEYHVWNVVRNIQRRVSKTQGLIYLLFLPLVFVASINESHASKVQVTDPDINSKIQSPEIPQPPQLPFDLYKIIDKAEHIVQPLVHMGKLIPDNYWVEDPAYRVEFTPDVITYYQKSNESGKKDNSLQFRLMSIEAADTNIPLNRSSLLTSEENRVTYFRTPVIKEIYEVRKDGVEQSWIIESPLTDKTGDLIIKGDLLTHLSSRANNKGGIDFLGNEGEYVTSYGKVIVIDSLGKRITLSPYLEDSRLTITVPEKWLSEAAYPVIVDPVLGADIRVDTLSTTDNYPDIAFDGTNYLIVWHTGTPNSTGTGSTAIRGARVSYSGTLLDSTPLTIGNQVDAGCTTNCDDQFPSVTYDALNSRYIVVWMQWDDVTAPVTSSNIWRNTVTSAGVAGTAVKILDGGSRVFSYPKVVCCDLNDRFYVVYGRSSNNTADLTSFFGTTYDRNTLASVANSNPTATVTSGGAGTVTPTAEPKGAANLTFLSASKYLLTWETFGADTNGDISANLLTITTAPGYTWGTQVSVAATAGTAERYPRAAYDGANAFIVYQRGLTTAADVYGRFVTPGAASLTLGASVIVSNVAGSGQTYPSVAYTDGSCSAAQIDRYMIVWQDYRNNAANPDIYGSPMNTAGTVETAVSISSNTSYVKERPVIAADSGSCGYMTSWSDMRNGNADIYANRIGYPNTGNLSPSSGIVGATISINGINFGNDPGAGNRSTTANNVKIDGIQVADANVTAWSDNSISFTIPNGTSAGTYPVTATAGSWVSNPVNLTVQVNTLQITTSSLPTGHQWISYGSNVSVTGGTTPYSWSIISGSLPAGVTLDSGTGLISGTPVNFGTFNFTVRVTDSTTPTPLTADQPLSILIYDLTTITVTPANPTILEGQNVQFTATGTYSDTTSLDISSTVTWGTTNPSVATVNSTGLATGTGLGAVTISATK